MLEMANDISNGSNISNGSKMTELGPLPEDWDVVKLEEIAEVKYGKAKPKETGNIPVVGSGGIYALTSQALVDFPSLVVGRKGTAGRVWLLESPFWPSDTTFYLAWKDSSVDYRFVYYCFQVNTLSGEHAKTTLPSLQKRDLENYVLPFPPLSEQRAIAYVLSTIQRAIEATERVIAATRELKKSLMHYLFTYGPVPLEEAERVPLKETEIGTIPEHWEVVRLGKVFEFSRKPRSLDINKCHQIPFISMEYIPDEEVYLSKYDLKVREEIKSGTFFFNGDLLIAKITPSFENGKQCIVKNLPTDFGYATTEVWPIHGTNEAEILCLFYYLKKDDIRADIASKMEGSTGRQRVPKNVLENLMIPYPPLSEQREIARILQSVDRKIETEKKRQKALKALFKTMLDLLMTGKVRVKDLEVASQ
ncbi:restriction endonuclease subunit S [Calderihabitans maritimus]|uniref:Restriction modification system DNA specificity subunit n=1 Tax=Calderihabitans maritimus TaxID=1246530 RepID=A0A1Z5HTV8_9FIRM|nr:restriction endonuclease subunit S [Calderihabitans maritimus]GAW92771.1 restriction modification system DNA specificity subunit [Calderihabitans maritimus]